MARWQTASTSQTNACHRCMSCEGQARPCSAAAAAMHRLAPPHCVCTRKLDDHPRRHYRAVALMVHAQPKSSLKAATAHGQGAAAFGLSWSGIRGETSGSMATGSAQPAHGGIDLRDQAQRSCHDPLQQAHAGMKATREAQSNRVDACSSPLLRKTCHPSSGLHRQANHSHPVRTPHFLDPPTPIFLWSTTSNPLCHAAQSSWQGARERPLSLRSWCCASALLCCGP